MNTSILRVLLGFLVAPGVPALVLYFINFRFVSQQGTALLGIILATLGYIAAIVVGIPAYLVLSRKKVFSLRAYLVFGALVGLIFYALFFGIWGLASYQSFPEPSRRDTAPRDNASHKCELSAKKQSILAQRCFSNFLRWRDKYGWFPRTAIGCTET